MNVITVTDRPPLYLEQPDEDALADAYTRWAESPAYHDPSLLALLPQEERDTLLVAMAISWYRDGVVETDA